MKLHTYRKKRNFEKTPEPKGKSKSRKSTPRLYLIQKHAASHLHYDFRLELNGVLLSWAVPKGPCLDPSVKRLAVHVEDHPLEYGSFEGVIPEGQYGAGKVLLWDTGEWKSNDKDPTVAYQKGHLSFSINAKKLKGQWSLIRINDNDKTWLLIKSDDQYAKSLKKYDITLEKPDSVKSGRSLNKIKNTNTSKIYQLNSKIKSQLKPSPYPKKISPQLATLVDKPPSGKSWLHEVKLDGYRLIAFKKGNSTHLVTRSHHDWTSKFKKIVSVIDKLPVNNAILDGEVVAVDESKHFNFQILQNSINEKNDDALIYYAFDLLYLNQFDLTLLPLIERKKILQEIIPKNNLIVRYNDHILGQGKKVFKKSCELGLEGIISKNIDSPYSQNRNKNWLKAICNKQQEFIIAGFTKPKRSRKFFGALLLGTYNKHNELIYCGNVGTGFTEDSLKSIYQALVKLKTDHMPFNKDPQISKKITWVKPTLLAEVEFLEWTQDGLLRQPSFKGLRTDKQAKNVKKETVIPIVNIKNNKVKAKTILKLTNPKKILYSEGKITKLDVADYYEMVQQWILPYVVNRPLTLLRCPNGYHHCFYQKHANKSVSPALDSITVTEKDGKTTYLYITDYDGLMALPQMGVLEIHPWGSRIDDLEYPDMIVFDLDPSPELAWKIVVKSAFEIKLHLSNFKLKSFVKVTGGKGLHIVIPIKPEYDWDEIKNFTHVFVNFLVMQNPKLYTSQMAKNKRKGKIYVDYLRNQRGATSIAPYSTRARKDAPIAIPLHWDELTHDFRDTFYTIQTFPDRLKEVKQDPWKKFFHLKQSLNLNKLK